MTGLSGVTGPVMAPGDAGYDAERAGYQTAYRHRPAVIVGARNARDVQAAVAYAAARGEPVAIQGSGHGLPAAADSGLLISTRRMNGVRVDAAAGTARIAAGARWKQVVLAAARYGLAPLSGSAPGVAAVPYTLGGGLGLLARQFGYAADHVRGFDVVTADGRLRHATAESESDLFWALRGAGSAFGVVTSMEIGLVPVAGIYGGALAFAGELAQEVLGGYLAWTRQAPEEVTSSLALMRYPDLPMFHPRLRGRLVAVIRIACAGSRRNAEPFVAPLRALAPPVLDSLREMPYAAAGAIYDELADPHAYVGDNVLLDDVEAAVPLSMLKLAGPDAPEMCVTEIRHLGGALSRAPAAGNAIGHRRARYLLRVLTPLLIAPLPAVRAAHRNVFDAAGPRTIGRAPNFVYGGGSVAAASPSDFYERGDAPRLRLLKDRFDSADMFRFSHGIPAVSPGQVPLPASNAPAGRFSLPGGRLS